MNGRYEQAVIERLSDRFGNTESTDLASALTETAKNAVEDNLQDYFSQLKGFTRDSFLEELDDLTVIDFEQLGVDRLFIDESHFYKNLYLYTKMRRVGGIAQTEAQKSSDLFMKCRYLDEITGNRGTIFATGTPVSNSMVAGSKKADAEHNAWRFYIAE